MLELLLAIDSGKALSPGSREFLLGSMSHTRTGVVPVRVTGRLRVEPSDATIFILDGEARMISGWTLDASTVERREDLGRNGVVGASEKTVTSGAVR
jgi:hypothetical protein